MMRLFLAVLAASRICYCRPAGDEDIVDDVLSSNGPPREATSGANLRKPYTPNQILQEIVEKANANIKRLTWDVSKNIRNGYADIPLNVVSSTGDLKDNLKITHGIITGFGSLRRSKMATLNREETVLTGTLVAENVCATGNYAISFPGVGLASAESVNGKATECIEKLFAYMEIAIDKRVPQRILSYTVRSGHDEVNLTNMRGSAMKDVHNAGARKALNDLLEKVMNTNIKVQINRGIQAIKRGA